MKSDIHPTRHEIEAQCVCGFRFKTSSTKPSLRVDLCAQCHPFFTGTQKFVDEAGRIQKFERRYKKA